MQIHLAKSDITTMAVDAVVNPANSLGIMGGGVAAALSRKGGPTIQKEAMSLAPIAVGAAVVTNAGKLFAKQVIHAPTMEQPGMKVGVENVRRATRAALLAAARNNLDVHRDSWNGDRPRRRRSGGRGARDGRRAARAPAAEARRRSISSTSTTRS